MNNGGTLGHVHEGDEDAEHSGPASAYASRGSLAAILEGPEASPRPPDAHPTTMSLRRRTETQVGPNENKVDLNHSQDLR